MSIQTRYKYGAAIFTALEIVVLCAYAQEVDVDALISSINAEIEQIDESGQPDDGTASDKPADSVVAPSRKPRAAADARQQSRGKKPVSKDSSVVVSAVGKGRTKEDALKEAFRNAVEKAVGVYIDAESMMQNSELVKDRVNTISNAEIEKYDIIKEARSKSGMYGVKIKAWVLKKAIAPKFKDVFPTAFADIGGAASPIHAQNVTHEMRTKDAASLMKAAIGDVDRMRNWVRLSAVKGMELRRVDDADDSESEGKGLYAVRYSMKVDEEAYLEGFVPHFKKVLSKMQEGAAAEEVPLSVAPVPQHEQRRLAQKMKALAVNPFTISDIPGMAVAGGPVGRGTGGNPTDFMFDKYGGLAKVQKDRTYNIWLLDRMNKDKTALRCSAYRVPQAALRAYWKELYGNLDSPYVLKERYTGAGLPTYEKVEVVLLDSAGNEIAAATDFVPATLLASGYRVNMQMLQREREHGGGMFLKDLWPHMNVFDSFFVRPLFVCPIGPNGFGGSVYASEIQRDVRIRLTNSQLAEVKQVKIRFVGSGRGGRN